MSNEIDEIEAIFDQIRDLSDELGLETRPYSDADGDQGMLIDILGAPARRAAVRRRVVGGLAALAAAASVVTAMAVGNGGSDRPNPDAVSASLAAPSINPDQTNKSRLDGKYSTGLSLDVRAEGAAEKVGMPGTLAGIASASSRIVLVEGDPPRVVKVLAGSARMSGSQLMEEASPGLRTGLANTGRLLYFLQDRPGRSSLSILLAYVETSPGVFVATVPRDGIVQRFTAQQLAEAIEKR